MNEQRAPGTRDRAKRKEANLTIDKVKHDIEGYIGRCLFVIDAGGRFCWEPVGNNKCHIVPETSVLKKLRDGRDKILELQWGISQWRELIFSDNLVQQARDATTFEPPEKTTADVCTGRFACKGPCDHDGEYRLVDVAQPDFDNPEVCLLTYLRLTQFWADQVRLALDLHRKWDDAKARQDRQWLIEREKQKAILNKRTSTLKLLGKNWYARRSGGKFDPDVISAHVLPFRSKVRLAGAVYHGTYSAHVFVYVFPVEGDFHRLAVLHLTSESEDVQKYVAQLEQVARGSEESDGYGVTVTEELMTGGWGVLAMSPKSYEELNDHDRATIRKVIERHSQVGNVLQSAYRQQRSWPRGRS